MRTDEQEPELMVLARDVHAQEEELGQREVTNIDGTEMTRNPSREP